MRKLYSLISRCHQMLGDLPAALNVCAEGLRLDPDDGELYYRKCVLHRKAGQAAEAEACWRRILALRRPDQFCSVDQGLYGHLPLRNLDSTRRHEPSLKLGRDGAGLRICLRSYRAFRLINRIAQG